MAKVLVITPTYNEVESLPAVIAGVRSAVPEADILVIDDGSPDGTADAAEALAATDQHVHVMRRTGKLGLGSAYLAGVRSAVPEADILVIDDGSPDGTADAAEALAATDQHVHVMRRTGKLGLGSAYLTGFSWALEHEYSVMVEMDADGSHPADRLPAMLAALTPGVGLSIGSRWVPGGSVVDWPVSRQLLSRGGNLYARLALGIRVKDATAGYRAYTADAIRAIDLSDIDSRGYCFQIDLVLRVLGAGYRVVEVPIQFRERTTGVSKMSRGIVAEAMWRVTVWGLQRPAHWLVRRRTRVPATLGDKVNG